MKLTTCSEMRLVDDDLNDVAPGESGEIIIRGPSIFMYVDSVV